MTNPALNPREIKLRMVKGAANAATLMLLRAVPKMEATKQVSLDTIEIIDRLKEIVDHGIEYKIVRFDNNIVNFLDAAKKMLVYICEEDIAYAGLLETAYAMAGVKYLEKTGGPIIEIEAPETQRDLRPDTGL